MIDWLTVLLWFACASCFGSAIIIARLIADVRLWRDDAREVRDLWKWERERAEFWRKRLEGELRRQQEGPYR